MKLTCLTKGSGYHSPPSHILDLCGFRLLIGCPLDLSALAVFAPVPTDSDLSSPLIRAEPWYKTPNTLHLWDISLIDAVLISSPAGMLGLPFLTRDPRFSGAIYATEVTARIGRLMMEELVSMHADFVQFYGRGEQEGCPDWMKWEEIEKLSPVVRDVVVGVHGEALGSWMPLYSTADIKECMLKVQSVKYAEEACFNSTLILKAFSSGLEIGSCNWTINGPRRNIAYLSSSIFRSAHAMGFDYRSLQGCDLLLFSEFSSLVNLSEDRNESNEREGHKGEEHEGPISHDILASRDICDNEDDSFNWLLGSEECSEETDKISFICSSVMDSVTGGGSVLIPIGRLGIILLLLEQISQSLESSNLKVPIYMISTVAEETLTLTDAVPEWLCENRQQKLFSGEALFDHVKLIKEKKLHLFPQLHSPNLLKMWREPCIVFSPHYSLRLGPVVHLLRRWHADSRCLLILEQGVDPELALSPFKTPAIMVLQCSFLSGIKLQKIQPLLTLLHPKRVLLPEDLKREQVIENDSTSVSYFTENVTLRVPNTREDFEACLATDLALQLKPKRLMQNNMAIGRLTGQLLLGNGRYSLVRAEKPSNFSNKQLLHWGTVDPVRLLLALQERGIKGSINRGEDAMDGDMYSIQIKDPGEAVIETSATKTIICTSDESMAVVIYEAIASVCDGI